MVENLAVEAASAAPFRIGFSDRAAAGAAVMLRLDMPVLGGVENEAIFSPTRPAGTCGAFSLHRSGEWLLGCATLSVERGMESAARALYDDLLNAARGWHLCRVWNYVPYINASRDGIENYRAFCRGRACALQEEYGAGFESRLCAASAVGIRTNKLSVVFAATPSAPRHFENPQQVPAYEYPAEHGPRPPSFARATVTAGGRAAFISGTAAIKGHATIAPGVTAAQLDCTVENLFLVSRAAGLGDSLGAGSGYVRHLKIYLRHAADFAAAEAHLRATLLQPGDHVTWLEADICRAALNVEIEATLMKR